MTLGTVEQLPDYEAPVKAKTLDSLWLGAEETEPVYGTVYDESVLDFPGTAYVHGPEKRTYYAALLPEEYAAPERQDTPPFNGSTCVIEFTPLESGRADRRQTDVKDFTVDVYGHFVYLSTESSEDGYQNSIGTESFTAAVG